MVHFTCDTRLAHANVIAPTTHDLRLYLLHLGVLDVKLGDDLVVVFDHVVCQTASSQSNIVSHV